MRAQLTGRGSRVKTKVGSELKQTKFDSILGNEVLKAGGIKSAGSSSFVGANIVDGDMKWGEVKSGMKIPLSFVYDKKPSYVKAWPLYGPGAPEK